MKKLAILMLLALELAVGGCSNTPNKNPTTTTTANGYWEAKLTGGTGESSELNFVTQFIVQDVNGYNEPLNVISLNFFNSGTCFSVDGRTATPVGSASYNTNTTTDQVTGTLSLSVTSLSPAGNTLALTSYTPSGFTGTSNGNPTGTTGTLSNGVVVGTWTLTGPCTTGITPPPTGTFIMCQATTTCAPPAP